MGKLKQLGYLNMAVNNIRKIENTSTCESLYKLDLTLNFIEPWDLKSSLQELAKIDAFRELTLTGNPCTDWERCPEYCMAMIPQLARIDSIDVTKSMQIKAA